MGSEDTDILGPLKSAVIALGSVTDALDPCKVEHFVRSMSATPGQIVTSGIGKILSLKLLILIEKDVC